LVSGLAAGSSFAQAQSAPDGSWTGFSIYAGGGASSLRGDVDVADTTSYSAEIECRPVTGIDYPAGFCFEAGPIGTNRFHNANSQMNGNAEFLGTVGVGADMEVTSGLVIGAFADIDWSNGEASFTASGSSDGRIFAANTTAAGTLEQDYSYTIGGRIGLVSLNRQALLYVLAGYTHMEASGQALINNSIGLELGPFDIGYNAAPVAVGLPDSYDGATFGIGAEVKLSSLWFLKLEGRYTNLQAESVGYASSSSASQFLGGYENGPGCGPPATDCQQFLTVDSDSEGSVKIDPEIWSGRIALGIKLN
jgi:opacity protein-like surface antigen